MSREAADDSRGYQPVSESLGHGAYLKPTLAASLGHPLTERASPDSNYYTDLASQLCIIQ